MRPAAILCAVGIAVASAGCRHVSAREAAPGPTRADTTVASEQPAPTDSAAKREPTRAEREADFWRGRTARDPSDYIARIRLADALLQCARESGAHEPVVEADNALREALSTAPDADAAWASLAFVRLALHRFDEAREAARRALELDPTQGDAWAALGDASLELEDLDTAAEAYARLEETDRGLFSLTRLANLAAARGDDDEALALLREAADVARERGLTPAERGRCDVGIAAIHMARGRLDEADAALERARAVWPDGYLVLEHLARLRLLQGRAAESAALYRRAAEGAPHPDVLEGLAAATEAAGDAAAAAEIRAQAHRAYVADIESGDTGHLRHFALFLADRGEAPDEAVRWAREDVRLRDTATARVVLAWTLHRGGRTADAVAELDALGDRLPRLDADMMWRVGEIWRAAGRPDWRTAFEAALSRNPRGAHAARMRDLLAAPE